MDLNRDSAPRDQRRPEAHFRGGTVLSGTGCRGSSLVSHLRAKVGMPDPWKDGGFAYAFFFLVHL